MQGERESRGVTAAWCRSFSVWRGIKLSPGGGMKPAARRQIYTVYYEAMIARAARDCWVRLCCS